MFGGVCGFVPGYLNNLSINRPDRKIRLVATDLRLVGLVPPRVIQVPSFRVRVPGPTSISRLFFEVLGCRSWTLNLVGVNQ